MAKRSTIPLNGCLSLVLLWLFSLAIARRCDRSVHVDSWTRCLECSLNRFQRCPRGYRALTSGDGIQRCSYLINFGANFGHIAVIGCQHLCTRTIIRRECCAGFWGRDCQGRKVFCFFFSFLFSREKGLLHHQFYHFRTSSWILSTFVAFLLCRFDKYE